MTDLEQLAYIDKWAMKHTENDIRSRYREVFFWCAISETVTSRKFAPELSIENFVEMMTGLDLKWEK